MMRSRHWIYAAAVLLSSTGATAAVARPLDLTFNLGAASDYVFRGVSQTQSRPEVFGGADIAFAKVGYAGAWLSNVDFGDSTSMEYDLYAGVKPSIGPVTLDIGALRYGYTNQPSHADWTYYEFKGAASMTFGPATFGGAFFYSPNVGGPGKIKGYYYEANGAVSVPNSKFSVSGAVGRQEFDGTGDYTTWDLGVGYALTDRIGLDLRYWDTDEHSLGKAYKARAVLSAKVSF